MTGLCVVLCGNRICQITMSLIIYPYCHNFLLGSPPWSRGECWTCASRVSGSSPGTSNLKKLLPNLNENSWTPTKIITKRSLHSDGQAWSGHRPIICAVVRSIHIHFLLVTNVKKILSQSTNTFFFFMILKSKNKQALFSADL